MLVDQVILFLHDIFINQTFLSLSYVRWERGMADASTILYYLSRDKNILEVIRNGHSSPQRVMYNHILDIPGSYDNRKCH